MRLSQLWLVDFRNYAAAEFILPPDGLTVIVGDNGQGKTNLLEAVAWLATLDSFRGAPAEALVRTGASTAVVRAEGERDGRRLLVEGQLTPGGRTRVLLNRQPLRRARDLLGALRVTVFAPDDLALVKAGPSERRRYLDDLLVACHPRWAELRAEVDRILRQRAVLLKQAKGRLTPEVADTLDVWDTKLAQAGTELADGRAKLVGDLEPEVVKAYDALAGQEAHVSLTYTAAWRPPHGPGLVEALQAARQDDVRRGVSTVGPHRDDLSLAMNGLPARTHTSQGEQRCLALALRLGGHAVVTDQVDSPPVLLLDDVFSELDPGRTAALVANLPIGQALLTTAGTVPAGIEPAAVVRVEAGHLLG